jgi:hypothetical protein
MAWNVIPAVEIAPTRAYSPFGDRLEDRGGDLSRRCHALSSQAE